MKPPDKLKDFRNVLALAWKHLNLPSPTPVQYDIAHFIQYGPDPSKSPWEPPNNRLEIMAFRGVGKSWITSVWIPTIHWYVQMGWYPKIDSTFNALVVSASGGRSDEFTTFVWDLINDFPLFHSLVPSDESRTSKIAFDVAEAGPSHSPSVKSLGVESNRLVGSRADLIIPDDVESIANSASQTQREKLQERVKQLGGAIVKPQGRIIYLGTPQLEETLYETLEERGYHKRIWPSRYPDEREVTSFGPALSPFILKAVTDDPQLVRRPTDPLRFDNDDLLEREAEFGRSGYALQFQLDTTFSDSDRHPLKLSDLIVMDLDPKQGPDRIAWASGAEQVIKDLPMAGLKGDRFHSPLFFSKSEFTNYSGIIMTIDPSGRGKDETATAIVAVLNGMQYLLDIGGYLEGSSEATLLDIGNKAKSYGVKNIIVEETFGGGMFANLLTPIFIELDYRVGIEEKRYNKAKEQRICDVLEPLMNQHRLCVSRSVIARDHEQCMKRKQVALEKRSQYQLFFQLTHIAREKGSLLLDDKVDVLAMACQYWADHMATHKEHAYNKRREARFEKELERYMKNAIGGKRLPKKRFFSRPLAAGHSFKRPSWKTRQR